jgi:dipeptidyl aminopeptidase/acylaminoacyl peptidase
MSKRTLIIVIIVVLLIAGIGGYLVYSRTSTNTNQDPNTSGNTNGLPISTNQNPGSASNGTTSPAQGNTSNTNQVQSTLIKQRSIEPISGSVVYALADGPHVRYNERVTGHVFDVNLKTGTSSRISNETLPQIYESLWSPDGKRSIYRYVKNNQAMVTYSLELVPPKLASTSVATTTGTVNGSFLPQDIDGIVLSPTAKNIFYIAPSRNDANFVVANADGSGAKVVRTSPLKHWLVGWPSENTVSLTTKPTYNETGSLYFLNPKTGAMNQVLRDIPGLTTLVNPAGTQVLYSTGSNELNIYDITSKKTLPINLQTLPEKCVWSKKEKNTIFCTAPSDLPVGNYPDDWYQGTVSFADDIYRVDTTTGTVTLIFNISAESGRTMDVIQPTLSPDEDYFVFTNKLDYSLWSIAL